MLLALSSQKYQSGENESIVSVAPSMASYVNADDYKAMSKWIKLELSSYWSSEDNEMCSADLRICIS